MSVFLVVTSLITLHGILELSTLLLIQIFRVLRVVSTWLTRSELVAYFAQSFAMSQHVAAERVDGVLRYVGDEDGSEVLWIAICEQPFGDQMLEFFQGSVQADGVVHRQCFSSV